MLTNTLTESIQKRWQEHRPFAVTKNESLLRKLHCPAVSRLTKDHARYELRYRGHEVRV